MSNDIEGFPAGMVGYCRMGHPEIYSRDIVCPLCAHIAASAEKYAALEEELNDARSELNRSIRPHI